MKSYPDKVLLAWGEAMRDNDDICRWLSANGYPELVTFILSLKGSKEADKWLFDNGHPEMVALVDFIYEKKEAAEWLDKFEFTPLKKLAEAAMEEEGAQQWLASHGYRSLLMIVPRLKKLIEDVDFDANDVHKSPFR